MVVMLRGRWEVEACWATSAASFRLRRMSWIRKARLGHLEGRCEDLEGKREELEAEAETSSCSRTMSFDKIMSLREYHLLWPELLHSTVHANNPRRNWLYSHGR